MCSAQDFIEKEKFLSPHQQKQINIDISPVQQQGFYALAQIWEKKKPSKIGKLKQPTIPKIIHQVWIGNNPLPPLYQAYIQECKALHPDWEYKLWTDKNVENWDFPAKDLYLKARNYQEKTNILRVAAIHKYGGLYLDTDILCIKPYDEILDYYEFFAGLEPNYINPWLPVMNNAFFAAVPNHPILNDFFTELRKNWDKQHQAYEEQDSNEPIRYLLDRISLKNSFPQFSRSVTKYLNKDDKKPIIVFPIDYFFPIFSMHNRTGNEDSNQYTFSIHDYAKNLRLIKFLYIDFVLPKEQQVTRHYMIQKKYKQFKRYSYRPNTIAKTMFFVSNTPPQALEQWHEGQYRTWQQQVWSNKDLEQKLSTKQWALLQRTNSRAAFELLSGIMLIHEYGGVYINNKAQPAKENLFDLVYSLDFFAGLTNMDQIVPTASSKALGSKPKHEITMRILEDIENHKGKISLTDIQNSIWNKAYEYINIDGRNTFLPQQYFEPKNNTEYAIMR